jgi:hypothetical protein
MLDMALQTSDFQEALKSFRAIKPEWDCRGTWGVSPWATQRRKMEVLLQLVKLACEVHRLDLLVPELEGMNVSEEMVNMMLVECSSTRMLDVAKLVESIARTNQAPMKDSTLTLLIKEAHDRPWRARPLVKEAMWRDSPDFSEELALAILSYCLKASDKAIAETLLQQMREKPSSVCAAFVEFLAAGGYHEEACSVIEQRLPSFNGDYLQHHFAGLIDSKTRWSIMLVALQQNRIPLATYMFDSAASKDKQAVASIQKWWRRGFANLQLERSRDLEGVVDVGCRISQVFQMASVDHDEELARSLLFSDPVKPSKGQHRRRSPSPDCSTSEGTLSDSDCESADEWMTKAAYRPPPGLEHLVDSDAALLGLLDPLESNAF